MWKARDGESFSSFRDGEVLCISCGSEQRLLKLERRIQNLYSRRKERSARCTVPSWAAIRKKRHGIVLAKSIPAKRFGIQTGEPLVSACRKCPDLIVIPPDYSLYVRASRALMKLLERYSDQIIPYSIDEAWVILEGFGRLYGREQMVNLAWQMKEEIRDRLGFTVNIGVSHQPSSVHDGRRIFKTGQSAYTV